MNLVIAMEQKNNAANMAVSSLSIKRTDANNTTPSVTTNTAAKSSKKSNTRGRTRGRRGNRNIASDASKSNSTHAQSENSGTTNNRSAHNKKSGSTVSSTKSRRHNRSSRKRAQSKSAKIKEQFVDFDNIKNALQDYKKILAVLKKQDVKKKKQLFKENIKSVQRYMQMEMNPLLQELQLLLDAQKEKTDEISSSGTTEEQKIVSDLEVALQSFITDLEQVQLDDDIAFDSEDNVLQVFNESLDALKFIQSNIKSMETDQTIQKEVSGKLYESHIMIKKLLAHYDNLKPNHLSQEQLDAQQNVQLLSLTNEVLLLTFQDHITPVTKKTFNDRYEALIALTDKVTKLTEPAQINFSQAKESQSKSMKYLLDSYLTYITSLTVEYDKNEIDNKEQLQKLNKLSEHIQVLLKKLNLKTTKLTKSAKILKNNNTQPITRNKTKDKFQNDIYAGEIKSGDAKEVFESINTCIKVIENIKTTDTREEVSDRLETLKNNIATILIDEERKIGKQAADRLRLISLILDQFQNALTKMQHQWNALHDELATGIIDVDNLPKVQKLLDEYKILKYWQVINDHQALTDVVMKKYKEIFKFYGNWVRNKINTSLNNVDLILQPEDTIEHMKNTLVQIFGDASDDNITTKASSSLNDKYTASFESMKQRIDTISKKYNDTSEQSVKQSLWNEMNNILQTFQKKISKLGSSTVDDEKTKKTIESTIKSSNTQYGQIKVFLSQLALQDHLTNAQEQTQEESEMAVISQPYLEELGELINLNEENDLLNQSPYSSLARAAYNKLLKAHNKLEDMTNIMNEVSKKSFEVKFKKIINKIVVEKLIPALNKSRKTIETIDQIVGKDFDVNKYAKKIIKAINIISDQKSTNEEQIKHAHIMMSQYMEELTNLSKSSDPQMMNTFKSILDEIEHNLTLLKARFNKTTTDEEKKIFEEYHVKISNFRNQIKS